MEKCNFKERKTSITSGFGSDEWCALTSHNMKCPGEEKCIFFRRKKK